jgi:hypothetical protein
LDAEFDQRDYSLASRSDVSSENMKFHRIANLSSLSAAIVLALACAARGAEAEGVTVRKAAVTVVIRTFNPQYPSKDMPKLEPSEAAVTQSGFACAVQIEVETRRPEDEPPETKIITVRADLRLDVTEWIPKDASTKIRNHEEGHRRISEIFYEDADKSARDLAAKYLGRKLEVKGEGIDAAIKAQASEFCKDYLDAVEKPAQKAQEQYDKLTDHGRNKVPEKTAIEKAMEFARPPTTTPAE